MRNAVWRRGFCIFIVLAFSLHAEETAKHKWTRRVLAGAACGVSAYTGIQTAHALTLAGIKEANPFGFGPVSWTFKAVGCVMPIVMGEIASHRAESPDLPMVVSAGSLGFSLFTAVHNQNVIDSVKQPGQVK